MVCPCGDGKRDPERLEARAHCLSAFALLAAAVVMTAVMLAAPMTASAAVGRYGQKGIVLQVFGNGETKLGEPMQLQVYVDRGVDPGAVPSEIALFDAPYIRVWQSGGNGGGRIVRSDAVGGIPGWAFTGTGAGNVRLVVNYGPFTTAVWIRVTDGKWKPVGVTLRKSALAPKYATENEDYGLETWVDYEGVDPKMVGQTRRQGENRIFEWTVSDPASCSVRDYAGFKFKAAKPGRYTVAARYGPFSSNPLEIQVRSRFAGTYKGSIRVQPVARMTPRLSDIEFTVGETGVVEGTYHYGMSMEIPVLGSIPIETAGSFKGTLDEDGRFAEAAPGTRQRVDLSARIRALMGNMGGGSGSANPVIRQQIKQFEQTLETAMRENKVNDSDLEKTRIEFAIVFVGGIRRADGKLGEMPFSASTTLSTE